MKDMLSNDGKNGNHLMLAADEASARHAAGKGAGQAAHRAVVEARRRGHVQAFLLDSQGEAKRAVRPEPPEVE
jgi:hypothetical protein